MAAKDLIVLLFSVRLNVLQTLNTFPEQRNASTAIGAYQAGLPFAITVVLVLRCGRLLQCTHTVVHPNDTGTDEETHTLEADK